MNVLKITSSFTAVLVLSAHPPVSFSHRKGIYETKAEAEQRASEIGCTSVHENKGHWMPCSDERELHRQLRKQ
jgi:hypothetical protein